MFSTKCVISEGDRVTTFAITDIKLYVLVVTLSTQDNAKLLQESESGFKRTINWNKYQTEATIQAQNQYLDYWTNPSFQGLNRLFVLSFENNADRIGHARYFFQK